MTTLAKVESNRTNAKRSTGPKSVRGKAVAKLNAVSHGLRSLSPVLPGERPKDWNGHRAGMIAAIAPVGTLEAALAERVALLSWRLRRVVAYETTVCRSEIDKDVGRIRGEDEEHNRMQAMLSFRPVMPRTYAMVKKELDVARECAAALEESRVQFHQLRGLPADHRLDNGDAFSVLLSVSGYTPGAENETFDIEDHQFLSEVGVPEEWRDDPDWWDGWTAEMVRSGVKLIAEDAEMTPEDLIEKAVRDSGEESRKEQLKARQLEQQLDFYAEQIAVEERVALGRALLPREDQLDKVMRDESHLNRQLMQTLHQLERMQATRAGNPPPSPAALDVTVEGSVPLAT